MSELSELQKAILRWRQIGPAGFAKEVFGVEPTPQQWEASKALVDRRRVSIRSGHGTGKSTIMAWAVIWFLCCYFPCKIPCTAPTGHQLEDILWSEIAKWLGVMGRRFPALAKQLQWRAETVELASNPREAFAVARTSRPERPEALQGFHSENLMFLIDEASGIPDEVFQVAEGALSTEGAYVLMAANPTRMDGYFYDSHHKQRDRWACLHWSGEDSPMVSKSYVKDMADKYGIESAIYRIRVRGDFAGNPDGIIPIELIESAISREIKPFGPEVWGLDVARFGEDRTALARRRVNVMQRPVEFWQGKDTMQTAGMVKLRYDEAKEKPEAIFVDVIGLGAGVVDRMKELKLPVIGINVAETPSASDKYNRLRDELWFRARDWFQARDVQIVDDSGLVAELTLPTYKITSSGKIQVESKDEMKKRGVTSPDIADAFCLTFAQGRPLSLQRKPIQYPNLGMPVR